MNDKCKELPAIRLQVWDLLKIWGSLCSKFIMLCNYYVCHIGAAITKMKKTLNWLIKVGLKNCILECHKQWHKSLGWKMHIWCTLLNFRLTLFAQWATRGPTFGQIGSLTGQIGAPSGQLGAQKMSKDEPHSRHSCLYSYIPFAGLFLAHLRGPSATTEPIFPLNPVWGPSLPICGAYLCPCRVPICLFKHPLCQVVVPLCPVGAPLYPLGALFCPLGAPLWPLRNFFEL